MSQFIGNFIITPSIDERTARIHEAFQYQSDLLQRSIVIPAGFVTDGASVPRLFWNIIPPWGQYGRAAVVHDYLYRWQRTTREDADDTLLEAMWVCRCRVWQQMAIWIAVRLFGDVAWCEDSKKPLSPDELAPNSDVAAWPH